MEKQPAKSTLIHSIVKFNPFLISRSIAAIHYETKLFSTVFFQGGIGYTYNKDWIQGVFGNVFENDRFNSFSKIVSYGEKDSKGLYISADLRLYFDDEAPHGGYVSAAFRRYNYNVLINPLNPDQVNTNFLSPTRFNIVNNALTFNFGYQLVTEGKIASTHDFFMGIGFRNMEYNRVEEAQMNTSYGTTSTYYRKSAATTKSMGFLILIGYSFGIGF